MRPGFVSVVAVPGGDEVEHLGGERVGVGPEAVGAELPSALVEFVGGEVGDAVGSDQGGAGDPVLWVDQVADSVAVDAE